MLDCFQKFHVAVERETELPLKAVCSDNRGECICQFEEYCRKHEIKHEKIVSKTPQQNGLAEKMNCTICENVRSMLSYAKLPRIFKDEAMRTSPDIINLSTVYASEMNVLEHVLTEKDVSYKHVKVFGHRAFTHITKDERSRLDDKARSCIYFENSHDQFGGIQKRKRYSRAEVIFLEN